MKRSLSKKLILVFSAILISVIALNVLISAFLLEKVYRKEKIDLMRDFYSEIKTNYSNGATEDEIAQSVKQTISNENIRVYIWDESDTLVLDSFPLLAPEAEEPSQPEFGRDKRHTDWRGRAELFIFNAEARAEDIICEDEDYSVISYKTELSQSLYLRGKLPGGFKILVKMPISPMSEAVKISNYLSILVGILTLIAGIFIVAVTSNTIARPIKELSWVAEAMRNLDFSKKYTGERSDEIGSLGESINSLSEKLEDTILKLREKNEQLEREIESKTRTDVMRKEFIANASHELKTPIALIAGYAEGLRDNVVKSDNARETYAEVIIDETKKMNRIVRQMLDLMEIEGAEKLKGRRFSLSDVVDEAANACGLLAENNSVRLKRILGENCTVYGDCARINQAVINYITNAINHVDEKKEILIKTEDLGERVLFSVYNSGKNIPESAMEEIWTRFYKVDKAHTREYGGSGLGLAIVRSVINLHGGEYGVENLPEGVRFYFILNKEKTQ